MRSALGRVCVVGLLVSGFVAGCSRRQAGPTGPVGGKLQVVASIFPLSDLAARVGGDRVDVVTILPPGQSPHEFEPKPRQAEKLAHAQLLITVGLGLDTWADRAAQAANNPTLQKIVLADFHEGAKPAPAPGYVPPPPRAYDVPEEERTDQETDPHIWLDISLMERYVDELAKMYASLDAAHASEYAERAKACHAELAALDQEYSRELAAAPNKSFVCFHAAFGSIASRYDLTQVSLMDVSGAAFGPGRIERAIRFIREHHIKTLFAEPDQPQETLQAIAAQTGCRIARLDPLGNPTVPGYDSYVALMRSNLKALVEALKE